MLDSVATMKQPAPTGDGADVTDLVIGDLRGRREAGTAKYGTPLRTGNGRDALVDAYQESCDLTLYLRQQLAEDQASGGGVRCLWRDHAAWSRATFGDDEARGPKGPLAHLELEAGEAWAAYAAASPEFREEMADCLLLVMDAARRGGMTLADLVRAARLKLEVNRGRTWPTPASADEPVLHEKA